MPDDKASREVDLLDLDKAEKMVELKDEAIAEEDFVAVEEDKVNPMLFDEEEAPEEPVEPTEEEKLLSGAIGSGNLEVVIPEQPFNNEEALRKENVNEDNKPTTPTTETDGAFVDPFASVESTVETPANTAVEPVAESAPVEEPAVETSAAPVETEPVAEAAPVEEPVAEPVAAAPEAAPVADSISATVPADPAAEQAAAAAEPKKKKKTGLIIGIIVALLVIGGGIGFFVWYMIHESTENTLKDAVSNIWNAENISAKGNATVTTKQGSETVNVDVTFEAKSNDSGLSLSGDLKSKVPSFGDISLGGNLVAGTDGVAYIKLNNIKDLLSGLMGSAMSMYDDEDVELMSPEQAFQLKLQKAMFEGMGEALSDTWFKIDTSEESETKCVLDKAKSLNSKDFRKKISDAYEKNPFIVVDEEAEVENRDGLKYITVKIDEKAQEEFTKALKEMAEVKELEKCSDSKDTIDSEIEYDGDKETEKNDLSKATIKLGITGWAHELKKIEISSKDEKAGSDTTMKIDLSYDKVAIEIPSDAKDMKDISKVMKEKMVSKMTPVVEEYCGKNFTDATMKKQCVDSVIEMFSGSMEDVDPTDIFSGLAGGLTSTTGGSVINDYL